jgi:3-oxoacyl-[acyl-carrier-protein] synthase-3
LDWIETHTAAAESNDIYVPGGGSAAPLTEAGLQSGQQYINMVDGQNITRMATESLAAQIGEILKKHGASVKDYDLVLSHQANQQVNEKLFALLGVDPAQTYTTLWKTGNCSSASIGFALEESVREGKIKAGQKMLMVTMGAGYHFSVASLSW